MPCDQLAPVSPHPSAEHRRPAGRYALLGSLAMAVRSSSLTVSTRLPELVGMSPGAYWRQARRVLAGGPAVRGKTVPRAVRNREAPAAPPLLP